MWQGFLPSSKVYLRNRLVKMPDIKSHLLAQCTQYVDQRIANCKQAMDDAQAAANEEGKSSAGDKYETGRAMMQIERDKAAQQLEEALKLKKVLDGLDSSIVSKVARLGSMVETTHYNFYLSISAGKFLVEGKEFLIVSPNSPIGKLLLNLKVGDAFRFNDKEEIVRRVN
jgi:transcription elongation GreA/GreB family factor